MICANLITAVASFDYKQREEKCSVAILHSTWRLNFDVRIFGELLAVDEITYRQNFLPMTY